MNNPNTTILSRGILFLALLMAWTTVQASHTFHRNWAKEKWNNLHVIVFEECEYQGKAKSLPAGEFDSIRSIGVGNDQISSIIIPQGLAVEIFEHNDFRGHWYRLNQSQPCLKGNWNETISALRIVEDVPGNAFGHIEGYKPGKPENRCYPYVFRAYNGEGGFRFVEKERKLNAVNNSRINGEYCGDGLLRIELAKQDLNTDVLISINGQDYGFFRSDPYDDFRRKWYRKYITVDLPELDYVGQSADWGNTPGFGPRYSSGVSSGENWGNNYERRWWRPVQDNQAGSNQSSQNQNSTQQPDNCVPYLVNGHGRNTGIRFMNVQDFQFVGGGELESQVCHSGSVVVELAKKKVEESVTLTIGQKIYQFPVGDEGDRYQNQWYRKYIRIRLP